MTEIKVGNDIIYKTMESGILYQFRQSEINREVREVILKYEEGERHIDDLCKLLHRTTEEIEKLLGRRYSYKYLIFKESERYII